MAGVSLAAKTSVLGNSPICTPNLQRRMMTRNKTTPQQLRGVVRKRDAHPSFAATSTASASFRSA